MQVLLDPDIDDQFGSKYPYELPFCSNRLSADCSNPLKTSIGECWVHQIGGVIVVFPSKEFPYSCPCSRWPLMLIVDLTVDWVGL